MLTLSTDAKFNEVERLIDRITNMGAGEKRKIADGVRQAFQENFSTEGRASGAPWRQLAPRTVATRQQLGWSGSRPILKRTGRYERSFVTHGGEHIEEVSSGGGVTLFEIGSRLAFRIHERGGMASIPSLQEARGGRLMHVGGARRVYVPQRSVLNLGEQQEQKIIRLIDYAVGEIEKREWR